MKRVLTMTCAVAMALSLAACSTANGTDNSLTSDTVQESVNSALASNTAYAGTTVVGQITAINDTGVTLRLGELSVPNDSNQNHQTPPDQNDSQNQNGDNQTPPEKPEGEAPDGNGPQNQSGDSQTPPEKPEKCRKEKLQMETDQTVRAKITRHRRKCREVECRTLSLEIQL